MSAPHPEFPTISGIQQACDVIARRISRLNADRPIVGITGPVGSGKSTLARLIADAVSGFVLSTDRYLPDYAGLPANERDEPEHSDVQRLAADLAELRSLGFGTVPVWSFHEHRRVGEEHVRVSGPILSEGIMALHEQVLPQLDLAVFVEATPQTRWKRWEAIETSGERGWGVEAAREHFDLVAEPTFHRFAAAYRAAAHVIVINDHSNVE